MTGFADNFLLFAGQVFMNNVNTYLVDQDSEPCAVVITSSPWFILPNGTIAYEDYPYAKPSFIRIGFNLTFNSEVGQEKMYKTMVQ